MQLSRVCYSTPMTHSSIRKLSKIYNSTIQLSRVCCSTPAGHPGVRTRARECASVHAWAWPLRHQSARVCTWAGAGSGMRCCPVGARPFARRPSFAAAVAPAAGVAGGTCYQCGASRCMTLLTSGRTFAPTLETPSPTHRAPCAAGAPTHTPLHASGPCLPTPLLAPAVAIPEAACGVLVLTGRLCGGLSF